MTTAILALIAAITIPGTTEHGNIRPRDIVSTNVEQTVDHIVGQKGYATTNQVDEAYKEVISYINDTSDNLVNHIDSSKDEAIDTANKYTDEQIEVIQTQVDEIPTDAKNYTDKATNAVLSSAKSYTDSEVSKIINKIDYPVTSVNGKKGDVNLTSDDIGAPADKSSANLTEYIDNADAAILESLSEEIAGVASNTLSAAKKYTDDAIDGLATEEYVNVKANAAYVNASQNATNYCNVFFDQLQDVQNTVPDMINDGVALAVSNSNAYTDKAIGSIKLPITDSIGSITNTPLTEITRAIVTDDYFSEIISELDENFTNQISENNNAIFRDYTNKIAVASHDTLTNANAYTDKKVAAIKVTEKDPVFENWRNEYNVGIGNNAKPASGNSIAIGNDTSANYNSIAIGYQSQANNAIAIGGNIYMSEDLGMARYAIGDNIISTNGGSIVIGYNAITHGDWTITLGPDELYLGYSDYANIADRLNMLYLGDYNAGDMVDAKIANYASTYLADTFIQKGYEEDPKFTAWTNETYKILLGKGATANITKSDASAIVIGSGSNASDHSIALGEAIDGGKNNISIGSSISNTDTTNNIVIGNIAGNISGEPQKFGGIIIGNNATDVFGDSIVIGANTESHNFGSINFGSEAMFLEYGFTNIAERLNQIWFGDENLASMVMKYLIPEFKFYQSRLEIENVKPTVIESGKFYCFRPNSTAETAISLSPIFDIGYEDNAKLYLDYTTARSNITVSDSTITVLYESDSYKLNAFDAPNGQSNRYIVELKWFATTATEDGTKQKFLIVNAKKVSE